MIYNRWGPLSVIIPSRISLLPVPYLTCCGTVGLGDFDVFGDAVIEDVEDVVVVMGDCSDD